MNFLAHPLVQLLVAVVPKIINKKKTKSVKEDSTEAVIKAAKAVIESPTSTVAGISAGATSLYVLPPEVLVPPLTEPVAMMVSAGVAFTLAAIGVFWPKKAA